MGDCEHRAIAEVLVDGLLDDGFGVEVDVGHGLVQNEDFRFSQKCSC
jgi:hypothetical protein